MKLWNSINDTRTASFIYWEKHRYLIFLVLTQEQCWFFQSQEMLNLGKRFITQKKMFHFPKRWVVENCELHFSPSSGMQINLFQLIRILEV